ncbi:hypothetical protein CVT25_005368 [Psilocybe cyanescens]|uniref:Uncharacterized protein n=1 Tax=Psilocybe cyanescens TaxID=93625 RepID=A0A409XRT0_PSICY|nr:hypothetical protein CVT25_005368 [Psilocybe cyanescens]
MSFIDTPTTSSASAPANSRLQGKRPAIPRYAQTLSTPKAIDLFANDETAQKIGSYFEDPDIIFAIDELAKVSRAHQQEEREIRLARQRTRIRETMATALLDQLQSWGLERELYDVLREYRNRSPTVRKPSVPSLIDPPFQSAVPSRPLPARPPAYHRAVQFSPIIDNSPSLQISPSASTPSRSPIPTPTPRRPQNPTTPQRRRSRAINAANLDIFAQDAPDSNASTVTDTHPDIPSETAATTQKTSNMLIPIMEELKKIFSTTPELPTPQANHTETTEPTEVMDVTPLLAQPELELVLVQRLVRLCGRILGIPGYGWVRSSLSLTNAASWFRNPSSLWLLQVARICLYSASGLQEWKCTRRGDDDGADDPLELGERLGKDLAGRVVDGGWSGIGQEEEREEGGGRETALLG